MTTATTSNFSIQWIEWGDASGIAATNLLDATNANDATHMAIGAYDAADGVYFNPFTV